jgi:hypothetical protein
MSLTSFRSFSQGTYGRTYNSCSVGNAAHQGGGSNSRIASYNKKYPMLKTTSKSTCCPIGGFLTTSPGNWIGTPYVGYYPNYPPNATISNTGIQNNYPIYALQTDFPYICTPTNCSGPTAQHEWMQIPYGNSLVMGYNVKCYAPMTVNQGAFLYILVPDTSNTQNYSALQITIYNMSKYKNLFPGGLCFPPSSTGNCTYSQSTPISVCTPEGNYINLPFNFNRKIPFCKLGSGGDINSAVCTGSYSAPTGTASLNYCST